MYNNCDNYILLYLTCMKINNPSHTKCKIEFDNWYSCYNNMK